MPTRTCPTALLACPSMHSTARLLHTSASSIDPVLSMCPGAEWPVLAQRPWSPLVQQIRALERAADKRVDALSAAHGALQSIQSEFASLARQAEAAAASAQFSVDTGSTVERIQKLAQRMHLLQQVRMRQGMTHWVWCLCCPCSHCRHRNCWSKTVLV